MTINSISAAGLSQGALSSSNSNQLKQILDTLQNSLASGDLNGAQSAFQSLQKLSQNLATASRSSLPNSSQLSIDLTALGGALSTGDLSSAQSAFATIQSDLKNAASPSLTIETNVASQSQQLVQELLSSLNLSSSLSSTDNTTSVLETVYGSRGLNVQA